MYRKIRWYYAFLPIRQIESQYDWYVSAEDSIPFKIWNPKGSGAEINVSIGGIEAKGHYFYTRMIQEDSNMAWSSPIWVD